MAQKGIIKNSTTADVSAKELASIFHGILGASGILKIYNELACAKVDNNNVTIDSGVYSLQGYLLTVEKGTLAALTVDSGTAGYLRNDLVIAEFVRNGGGTGKDTLAIRVLKGTPDLTTPVDPTLNQEDISAAGVTRQEALFRIRLEGLDLNFIEPLATYLSNVSDFDSIAIGAGSLAWNSTDDTLDIFNEDGTITQVGQEDHWTVQNGEATPLVDLTVVRTSGTTGVNGRFVVQKMVGDGTYSPLDIIGVCTSIIASGALGRITSRGLIRNVDTTGTSVGEVWANNDRLWVHPTIAGALTKVEPTAPNLRLPIGKVIYANASVGTLAVRVLPNPSIANINDVDLTGVQDGYALAYDQANDKWITKQASGQMLGQATTKAISYNSQTIAENITIPSNVNASAVGPITVETGFTLTVETGARLVIL